METSSEIVPRAKQLYRRELPGAGYVAIDVTQPLDDSESAPATERGRIRVSVERRGGGRGGGGGGTRIGGAAIIRRSSPNSLAMIVRPKSANCIEWPPITPRLRGRS